MSSAVQQQNRVFAALHWNNFINILRGDIRIKYWSNARRAGWVACSAIRNLSTNSAFALGPRKTSSLQAAWRSGCVDPAGLFSLVHRVTLLTSVTHSALSSCLSDHCQDGTALLGKFQSHFKCVRIVAKKLRSFQLFVYLSVCPHVPARVPLDGILWNWKLGSIMKICQEIPNLVKIGQKYRSLCLKTQVCVTVADDNKSSQKQSLRFKSYQTKKLQIYGNTPQCYVKRTLPILFFDKLFNCFSAENVPCLTNCVHCLYLARSPNG